MSGDTIIFNRRTVTKICESNSDRFVKNIDKQKSFVNHYINPVPILDNGVNKDKKHYAVMPRLKCDNCIIWLSKTSINDIESIIYTFNNYIESSLQKSQIKPFDHQVWINKIEETEKKVAADEIILEILTKLKNMKFKRPFYFGDNHGDLTLSNLFIFEQSINAIDFLNTFIDSPINDIVKLRQDTKHLWTLNLIDEFTQIDYNKVAIFLQHMDQSLIKLIANDDIVSEYYLPFQILNLIRIIPYIKDAKILLHLKNEIRELANEIDINSAMCG